MEALSRVRPIPANTYAGLQPVEQRLILIAGADLKTTDDAAASLFEAGHVPMMTDWFAFGLRAIAKPDRTRRDVDQSFLNPITERLLARCDAVLRMPGDSPAADALVARARARGLRVHFSLQDALEG